MTSDMTEEIELFTGVKFSERITRAHFGCGILVISKLLEITKHNVPLKYLLWTLYFLKHNPGNYGSKIPTNYQTWLPKVRAVLHELNNSLPEFSLNRGSKSLRKRTSIIGVVDVTRTKIPKPSIEPWTYYSMKDKFHALKTEVVISLEPPYKILWINTGYRGSVADITIARDQLLPNLTNNQKLLADLGYLGEPGKLETPYKGGRHMLSREEKRYNYHHVMKRQTIERANSRLKIFKIVKEWNRKDYEFHSLCVSVV
ncbi:hypothetical protein HK103_003699, partial [Boothiomyces macroporosus]